MIIGVYLRSVDFSFKNLINSNPLITTLSRKIFSFRFECYAIFFLQFFLQKVCRKNFIKKVQINKNQLLWYFHCNIGMYMTEQNMF